MSGLTKLGILFFIAAIVVLGYQGVSTLMGQTGAADDFVWKDLSLADALGGFNLESLDSFSFWGIQGFMQYLLEAPLFIWLFGLSFLCFFIHAFAPRS